VNWSEQDLLDFENRRGKPPSPGRPRRSVPRTGADPKRFALGRLPAGTMNKTEAAYDAHLKQQLHSGAVQWYKFEGIKLRLADNTFYTCDFAVLPLSGILEMVEVKGFWQDDARVKIKVAASIYPFKFVAVKARAKKHGGGWEREEF
jgi:hypothetical protein